MEQIKLSHRNTAKPLADFLLHEAFQDGDGLLTQPDRVEDVVVEDRLKEVVLVVRLKWRLASHHLVHQHAKSPPDEEKNGFEWCLNKLEFDYQSTLAP